VAGPRLQQIGISERQVTHSNDEVAALSSLDLPARHLIPIVRDEINPKTALSFAGIYTLTMQPSQRSHWPR